MGDWWIDPRSPYAVILLKSLQKDLWICKTIGFLSALYVVYERETGIKADSKVFVLSKDKNEITINLVEKDHRKNRF